MSKTLDDIDKKIEEKNREREKRDAVRRARFSGFCADLERILEAPDPDVETLARQAGLLDCMLYTIMRDNLHDAKNRGFFRENEIELALRIQKQGANTAKAAAAVDYMEAVSCLTTGIYPPMKQVRAATRETEGKTPLPRRSPTGAEGGPPPPEIEKRTIKE